MEQRRQRRRPREEAGYKDSRPIGRGRGTGRIPALVSPVPVRRTRLLPEREGREVDEQVAALGSAAADPSSRLLLEKLASPAGGNRASRLGGPRRKEAAKPLSNWRKFRAAPLFFAPQIFFISRRASRFDEPADWTIASGCLGECRQVTEAPPPPLFSSLGCSAGSDRGSLLRAERYTKGKTGVTGSRCCCPGC